MSISDVYTFSSVLLATMTIFQFIIKTPSTKSKMHLIKIFTLAGWTAVTTLLAISSGPAPIIGKAEIDHLIRSILMLPNTATVIWVSLWLYYKGIVN